MLKVLFFVALFALAVYLLVRVIQRRGLIDQRPARRPARRPQAQRRQVAPDDDPEFLRDLDRKRRHPDDPEA